MNNYSIYLRKSRKDIEAEQQGEADTLARHEALLLAFARSNKIPISKIYKEVVSGDTIASRPEMQRLLTDVDGGVWQGVLVVDIDRLARGDTIDQGIVAQAFRYSNTKIITPMKTYDPSNEFDEEYFEFGLFMSRREYKTINRRLQRGRLASIKEGKYVANRAPYGYIRQKLEKEKGFTLIPHPDQAPVIKMIYEWYTNGEKQEDGRLQRIGICFIVKRLNKLGIPPQKGKIWVSASIRDILINPIYIGKLRWDWRPEVKRIVDGKVTRSRPRNDLNKCTVVNGRHEGIIDEAIFYLAQAYMGENPPLTTKQTLKNPLAGLIICGVCGRRLDRRTYTNGRAPSLICRIPTCPNVSSELTYIEQRLLDSLADWLREYKLKWEIEGSQQGDAALKAKQQALRKAEQALSALDQQRDNLHNLLERGVYDTNTFLERSRTLAERISQATQIVDTLKDEIKMEVARDESRRVFIPKIEHLLSIYKNLLSPIDKNNMLKEVLEKVIYTKETSGRWGSPDDFELTLFPRLPRGTNQG